MTEYKTYDQKAIQAMGNDSLIYFETTRSKWKNRNYKQQVLPDLRQFYKQQQKNSKKQTNKQNKHTKKTRDEVTKKQKKKKI